MIMLYTLPGMIIQHKWLIPRVRQFAPPVIERCQFMKMDLLGFRYSLPRASSRKRVRVGVRIKLEYDIWCV